jgi:hypothetical protein
VRRGVPCVSPISHGRLPPCFSLPLSLHGAQLRFHLHPWRPPAPSDGHRRALCTRICAFPAPVFSLGAGLCSSYALPAPCLDPARGAPSSQRRVPMCLRAPAGSLIGRLPWHSPCSEIPLLSSPSPFSAPSRGVLRAQLPLPSPQRPATPLSLSLSLSLASAPARRGASFLQSSRPGSLLAPSSSFLMRAPSRSSARPRSSLPQRLLHGRRSDSSFSAISIAPCSPRPPRYPSPVLVKLSSTSTSTSTSSHVRPAYLPLRAGCVRPWS